ncbi:TerB family tellurite resistance protein [Rhodobaculum claviforme]|uniref:Molecular chaperone DjlA n=1 Tax=Rhodobaculum claviforme TaxID=1549854 RepID=A0A934TKF5_9RHOB|nr:TerB family tellurite resistance protein [Rhodobaculum claviforme]MBK5927204.1 molecular chaperone DjlA [Rhodobaculum claviforme]
MISGEPPPETLWSRIAAALSALRRGEGLSEVFGHLRTPPERTVAFAIAVIALGAKMAKADGQVTRDEVRAFREVFHVPPEEQVNAARVFDLARQDVAGFDLYARRIARMFGPGDRVLETVLEGLFHIALADGSLDAREEVFLREVAGIFGISERGFRCIKAEFLPDAPADPYEVLDVAPDAPLADVRAAWARAVRDNHPDRLIARGVPAEAVRLAEARMVAINRAWEDIRRDAAP